MQLISVVIPAYNEEECIDQVVAKIQETFKPLNYDFELIFVDDGSKDKTYELIKKHNALDKRIKGVKLSRNMGHQAALDCGLHHASGDAIISMDSDLQHPPELVPQMIKEWENGIDIVTTAKLANQDAGIVYKIWAKLFYSAFNKFSQIKLTPSGSDFRLLSRRSLDALLSMPEYHKFYRGMVHFVGFNSSTIEFVVNKRIAGVRKYNFKQSLKLASDGLFSFSDFALKIPFVLGSIVLVIMLLYLLYAVTGLLFFDFVFEKGWSSIIVLIILSLSMQLIFMGVIGIYIGKIFFEVKKRPVFFAQEKIGDL